MMTTRRTASRDRRVSLRLECLESRQLLAAIINEYPLSPTLIPPFTSGPYDIASGTDGSLWFTGTQAKSIGEINATTHAVTKFVTAATSPLAIVTGPDGHIWFTDAGAIAEFDPTNHTFAEFAIPAPARTFGPTATSLTVGPDGNIWFAGSALGPPLTGHAIPTTYALLGNINPTSHVISEFTPPNSKSLISSITTGPDAKLWFTESGARPKIGQINPYSHAIKEFSLPSGRSNASEITSGPDGNLWFTETGFNKIGRINPKSHAISETRIPTPNSSPLAITAGLDGYLWFTQTGTNEIGRINPKTRAIQEFAIPTPLSLPSAITVGPDGNLWFAESLAGKAGQFVNGPTVLGVQRPRASAQSNQLVITFDKPLDPGRAQNPMNYSVSDPRGRAIAVSAATYNPATNAVTLLLAQRLNPRLTYRLTVVGTGSTGVADTSGNLLDGAGTGQPGSNFVTVLPRLVRVC